MNETGNIFVLHKSPDAVRSDFKDFLQKFNEDLRAIDREEALIKAALEPDSSALAKVATDANEVTFAGRLAHVKENLFGSPSMHTAERLVKWLNEFNGGYDRLRRLEKRSARFHGAR